MDRSTKLYSSLYENDNIGVEDRETGHNTVIITDIAAMSSGRQSNLTSSRLSRPVIISLTVDIECRSVFMLVFRPIISDSRF